jgi:hypothetical protein
MSFDPKFLLSGRKTVGEQVQENEARGLTLEDDVREYTYVMGRDIMKEMRAFADSVSSSEAFIGKDFYVVLVINADRMLHQPKFQFLPPRYSCPTPVYKQAVWKFHKNTKELEYLWNIPSKQRYEDILKNKQKYLEDPKWKKQAEIVLFMESGALLNWVKKECGELPDAIIRITPKDETIQ